DYVATCFAEYGLLTDPSGRYSAQWKPYHLIGLELGISVASVALRGEATGQPTGFRGDAVATAKRDLEAGEMLDGEGGYTVYGKLMPADDSLTYGGLPIGLAHGVALKTAVAKDQPVTWANVDIDATSQAVQVRREMEQMFAQQAAAAQ
ncbi:MAG: putative homoserine dehydrogenase-like protein, partial [Alphaproteobacteria bacterium]